MLPLLLLAAAAAAVCVCGMLCPTEVTDASCNQKSAVFDKPQGRKLALF
jgi:hypothetical protein